jgi:hypothetical protein
LADLVVDVFCYRFEKQGSAWLVLPQVSYLAAALEIGPVRYAQQLVFLWACNSVRYDRDECIDRSAALCAVASSHTSWAGPAGLQSPN